MALTNENIIKALEDSFKIVLSQDELENIYTPRDIEELIVSRVITENETLYIKERSFYILRKLISTEFGIDKSKVRVGTNICELIPKDRHEEFWNKLEDISQSKKFPSLTHPSWLLRTIGFVIPTTVILAILSTIFFKVWFGILFAFIVVIALLSLLFTKNNSIPSYYCNANEIIKFLTYSTSDNFIKDKKWDKEDILERIEFIITKELKLQKYDSDLMF